MVMIYFMYIISCLLVVLGFIALLLQKVYLDPKTDQPNVEVHVPFVGKMKTNFPSLAFLFLGVVMAIYAYTRPSKLDMPLVDWQLIGNFEYEGIEPIDFREGKLQIFPCGIKSFVSKAGQFQIEMKIEEGKSLEEEIQWIDYSHPRGSTKIVLKKEYQKWENNDPACLIEVATENSRIYKGLLIKNFTQ
jgi:hypothetical protein